MYFFPLKLKQAEDTKSGSKFDFCLEARTTTAIPVESSSRCFSVEFNALPSPNAKPTPKPGDFVEPTPEKNTKVICQQGQYCHMIVYTFINITTPKCKQVLVTNSLGGEAFPTKHFNNKCVTDVVFTNVDSEGTHQVCLKSWEGGESRCYFVEVVKNISDACDSNPCQNGGLCLYKNGKPLCICKPGYTGNNCSNGPCPASDTSCQNGGYCYMEGMAKTCFCKTGYSGPTCTHESTENITDIQHNGGKFTDAAYPTNTTCYVSKPCLITQIITGNALKNPLLRPGYMAPGIKIEEVKVSKQQNSTHTYHTTTILKAETAGLKKVCLQVHNEQGLTSDEACVNVTVVEGFHPKNEMFAHFVPPTWISNTEMECEIGRPCHLVLWTSNKLGVDTCPYIKSNTDPDSGVYIFQEPNSRKPCVNDVSIQQKQLGMTELCFSVIASIQSKNLDGETRCYQLNIVQSLSVKSACSNIRCKNGGFCDSSTLTGECWCVLGYSGRYCEIPKGMSLVSAVSNTGFTDLAITKRVVCHLNEKCTIPYSITTNSTSRPYISLGHYDEDLSVTTPTLYKDRQPSLNTYLGHMTVTPQLIGSHVVCIQTSTDRRLTTDDRCVDVIVKDNSTTSTVNMNLPHFQTPSLTNNTEVNCPASKSCHLLLSVSPGQHEGCPNVQATKGNLDFMHLFHLNTNYDEMGNNCTVDVAISPSSNNNNNSDLYCFEVSFPSVPGEKRCINVTYTPSESHCNTKPCHGQGYCKTSGGSGCICICKLGFKGLQCETGTGPVPIPRQGNETSKPSPTFVDTMLPKEITCHLLKDCSFMLPVNGSPVNKSSLLFGHLDNGIEPGQITLENITSPVNQTIAYFHVTPTGNGTKIACVQTRDSKINVDEVCVKIKITPDQTGSTTASAQLKPTIISPTFSNGTVLECLDTPTGCHLPIVTKPTPGTTTCPKVESTVSTKLNVHYFTPETLNAEFICHVDISIKPEIPGNQTFCFRPREGDKTGEERCYDIRVVTNSNKTFGGPCQNQHCQNGGRCEAKPPTSAICICPVGFTGINCENGRTLPPPTNNSKGTISSTTPSFTDAAIPDIIQCSIKTPCGFPFIMSGPPGHTPTVDTDSPFVIHPIKTDLLPGELNNTFQANVIFSAMKEGQQTVCAHVSNNRSETDEVCFKVNFTSATTTKLPTEKIKEPTITDMSSVKCLEKADCHLLVHTTKEANGSCALPVQMPHIPDTAILGTKGSNIDHNLCVTDIATRVNPGETRQLCFSTASFSDRRCITVNPIRNTTTSHCRHVSCNGGHCVSKEQSFICICQVGFSGTNCQQKVKSIPIPRPTTANITDNSTVFVNTGLPTDINCVLNEVCEFPIPIAGTNLSSKSIAFGYKHETLNSCNTSIIPQGPGGTDAIARFCVKPTQSGTHRVCVQTIDNQGVNNDEICLNIHTDLNTTPIPKATDTISRPSYTNGSAVRCVVENPCYIPVITDPTLNSECPRIKQTEKTTLENVHVFTPLHDTDNKCYGQIAIITQSKEKGNQSLCFKTVSKSGTGIQRCLSINIVDSTNKSRGGPCQIKRCEHFSTCFSNGGQGRAYCNCSAGYSGDPCEKTDTRYAMTTTPHLGAASISGCSMSPKNAYLEQLVKAAAIGAGGVGGFIAIAALIYVIVKKLQRALKSNRVKEETEVHAMTLNMTM
uniref:Uncharacterized protein LOC111128690 n=1 Tax=Crassostrea virginica TaxID=6565 RepID=A0A8B8DR71_CRAVI|nr:uncharacterized protein LOC111128690 [Crassostrea virginica]